MILSFVGCLVLITSWICFFVNVTMYEVNNLILFIYMVQKNLINVKLIHSDFTRYTES